jgi:DNA polymerase III subunit gamma/tau
MELDGATNGLVDDVRNLKTMAKLSHGGKYRVFIIDECHAMSREAFSALLKQLEEPPPDVLYILVTTDYNQLPATIVSRCLSFMYSIIEESDITTRLRVVCERERYDYHPEALAHIARRARGAMRDALMMLQHLAIVEDISLARAEALWPDDLGEFAHQFMRTVMLGDVKAGMAAIRETFVVHRNSYEMTDAIIKLLRDSIQEPESLATYGKLSLRSVADLMRHAWDLRIRLRSAPAADKTLVETLWFVFVKELGTAPSVQRSSAPTMKPAALASISVGTNGKHHDANEDVLALLEEV